MIKKLIALAEKGYIPDLMIRLGIRSLLQRRIKELVSEDKTINLKNKQSFINDMEREVHVSGEAFFDVHSDSLHPFKVYSTGSSAEVFGTKFNFKNYEEDNFSEIILTEGSLGVKNTIDKSEVVIIKPGDMARVDYSLGKIELSKVNTVLYTSWVDGRIIFRKLLLFTIS